MFKINPSPTFQTEVKFLVPGGEASVDFDFKYFTPDEFNSFIEALPKDKTSVFDVLMEITTGWKGVDTPFSKDALQTAIKKYAAMAPAMYKKFLKELECGLLGN